MTTGPEKPAAASFGDAGQLDAEGYAVLVNAQHLSEATRLASMPSQA